MAQNDGGGGGGNDGVFMIMGIMLAIIAIGYFYGTKITAAHITLKKAEIFVLETIMVDRVFSTKWEEKIGPVLELMEAPPEKLGLKENTVISANVNYFFRWIWIAILGYFGWKVYVKNPLQKFTRRMSMVTLSKSEEGLWPAIAPVNKLDILSEPFDTGKWAMSKQPMDFAKQYKLLDEDSKLIKDRAEKLFASQLGKLWEGPGKLPKATRALFAAFAAQIDGDLKASKTALDTLSKTAALGTPDYSWVNGYLAKYGKCDRVQRVLAEHAYVNTIMASMIEAAREFGVLASAQFIWLKPVNRTLWYTLNGVGRRVAFAEIGGIYAHWIAEKVATHPIERPYVIKAVEGLEKAILEVKTD